MEVHFRVRRSHRNEPSARASLLVLLPGISVWALWSAIVQAQAIFSAGTLSLSPELLRTVEAVGLSVVLSLSSFFGFLITLMLRVSLNPPSIQESEDSNRGQIHGSVPFCDSKLL